MEFSPQRYATMPYRRCGRSGLKLPAISLGLWQGTGSYVEDEQSKQILFTAFNHGITHFDCFLGMRHHYLLPHVINYNSGNCACHKGGPWQHALGVLVKMRYHDVLLDVLNYISDLRACDKG